MFCGGLLGEEGLGVFGGLGMRLGVLKLFWRCVVCFESIFMGV